MKAIRNSLSVGAGTALPLVFLTALQLLLAGCGSLELDGLFVPPADANVDGGPAPATQAAPLPDQLARDAGVGIDAAAPGDDGGGTPDGAVAPAPTACLVDFVVSGVDPMARRLMVVGDTPALGRWSVTEAVPMRSIQLGVWTTSVRVNDGDALEFKFVAEEVAGYAWEEWGADSNRALRVRCGGPGTSPLPAGPAIGDRYVGIFNVRPADATR